jgi:CheY-like chemotaxis protein
VGEFVVLRVSDNGAGMDEETRSRIFEPFFTTKEVGKGTGMGLATVMGIVKMSDGWIEVESVLGDGTDFILYFPKTEDGPAPVQADAPAEPEVQSRPFTVIFVEDDPSVRSYGVRCLRELGYTVLESSTGADALAIAAEYGDRIDLLVSDVVMPGMQGLEVAQRMVTLRPDIRVVLCSGYAEQATQADFSSIGLRYLAKPYSRQALGRAVALALDGSVDEQ